MSNQQAKTPIRYPGGKQRFLNQIVANLPRVDAIEGHFVEPFLGGGSVFFAIQAKPAILSDKNSELIDLYKGIRRAPHKVWEIYSGYKSGKREYYRVRRQDTTGCDVISKAARTLYLNRTCFKGMWRQNSQGRFNIGYGGQGRRWAITEEDLVQVAKALRGVELLCADFETVVDASQKKDFIFLDPPYHPESRSRSFRQPPRVFKWFGRFKFHTASLASGSVVRYTSSGVLSPRP